MIETHSDPSQALQEARRCDPRLAQAVIAQSKRSFFWRHLSRGSLYAARLAFKTLVYR